MDQSHDTPPAALTAGIVAAFISHNSVRASELPELISSVHAALANLGQPDPAPEAPKPVPAVSVKKSITPDHLISLEDGKRYKALKRHLSGRGMSPAEYRTKWGLPSDYPMVAANYAAQRSELARSIGLGRKRVAEPVEAPAPEAVPDPVAPLEAEVVSTPKRRGRKKAA